MQPRLILLGLNLVALSLILGAIGWFTRDYSIMGIASSIMLLSLVSIVMGIGHSEPSIDFLISYSDIVRNSLLTLAEYLNITSFRTYFIPQNDKVYVVVTDSKKPPMNPKPLIGFNDRPYLTLEVTDSGVVGQDYPRGVSLEVVGDHLRDYLVSRYSVCSTIHVDVENDTIVIRLEGIDRRIINLVKKPLSPLTLLTVVFLAFLLDKKIVLDKENIEDNTVILSIGVIS